MNRLYDMNIEVYSKKEYEKLTTTGEHCRLFLFTEDHYRHCKIEVFDKEIVGTTIIPDKTDLIHNVHNFGYILVDSGITFIDDTGIVDKILNEIDNESVETIDGFFFQFMEYLAESEVEFIQSYKEKMANLEEALMNYEGSDDSKAIIQMRKELQVLYSYYQQLMEVGEVLQERFSVFKKFTKRMNRLMLEVKELREYSLQIRELYQTQISVRQNKIMQLLTVVTTIFMPLNLLTGWYGMNFSNMTEMQWKYGYLMIICISLIIILLEVWYFKYKKWFR